MRTFGVNDAVADVRIRFIGFWTLVEGRSGVLGGNLN